MKRKLLLLSLFFMSCSKNIMIEETLSLKVETDYSWEVIEPNSHYVISHDTTIFYPNTENISLLLRPLHTSLDDSTFVWGLFEFEPNGFYGVINENLFETEERFYQIEGWK